MTFTLILAVVLPLAVLLRRAVHRDGLEVDHVVLFSLGFLTYAVLPFAIPSLRIFSGDPAFRVWYRVFDESITPSQATEYLAFVLLMYCAFVVGSALGAMRGRSLRQRSQSILLVHPAALNLFFIAAGAIAAAYAWQRRAVLFTGYTDIAASAGQAGPLTAATLVLLSLAFLRVAYADVGLATRKRFASRIYIGVVAFFAIMLLSLGGRLYVASGALMMLCYMTVYRRRLRYAPAVALLVCGLVIVGAIGAVRGGGGAISVRSIAQNLFSEPLFTSFSAVRFAGSGRFELINFPRFLLSDLLNLVPSALVPNKAALLVSPADYGYVVYMPLGALHMFLSFMTNFGLLGSMGVLGLMGAGLSALRRRSRATPVLRVSYVMLAGWMAFTLFRDPFSVSLVKNMFEFSIVVPWMIVIGAHVVTVVAAAGKPLSRLLPLATIAPVRHTL